MVIKTLRDMLSIFYACENVKLNTDSLLQLHDHFNDRKNGNLSRIFSQANDDGLLFKSLRDGRWNSHPIREIFCVDVEAECVEIPIYLLFAALYCVHYRLDVRRTFSINSTKADRTGLMATDIMSTMFEMTSTNFGQWILLPFYHTMTIGESESDEDMELVKTRISSAYDNKVYVSSRMAFTFHGRYMIVPKDNEVAMPCLNRLKLSFGVCSEQIWWNLYVEDNIDNVNFKKILDTIFAYTPDIVLDSRLV